MVKPASPVPLITLSVPPYYARDREDEEKMPGSVRTLTLLGLSRHANTGDVIICSCVHPPGALAPPSSGNSGSQSTLEPSGGLAVMTLSL